MLTTSLFSTASQFSLGQQCGYVLHPEYIQLNAELCVNQPATSNLLSVQLWASKQVFNGGTLQGHLVAATQPASYEQYTLIDESLLASWPVGQRDYVMVLVLVDEESQTIISYFNFEQTQQFLVPYLSQSSIEFKENEAVIDVAQIFNPRAMDNLSGTLSLELWALSAPYVFDSCEGELLTIEILGELYGQNFWAGYQLKTTTPANAKQLSLLLREWTAKGYVTRDYISFDVPVMPNDKIAQSTVIPVRKPRALKAKAPTATKATTSAKTTTNTPNATKTPKVKASDTKYIEEVNNASLERLVAIKGISSTVANHIIESKPYQTWTQLGLVKGVGGKMLLKLKAEFGTS